MDECGSDGTCGAGEESSSSYLVHSETTSDPLDCQSRAQYRIHAPVRRLREQTINALWHCDDPRLTKRAQKLGLCCIAPTVYVGVGCTPTCSPGRCRDRLCPTCAMFRAGSLRSRIKRLVTKARSVRFVTLTMAPVATGLGECVDALMAAMRLMRALEVWKRHVEGGIFVVEVTRGATGKHWHVHAHLLIEGEYFPHDLLHDAWSRAVGSASRVEIKALHDREACISYMAKYMAKSTAMDSWTHDEIREYALGMHRRRIVGTFGTWHRCKVDVLDAEPVKPPKASLDISFVAVEAVMEADVEFREKAAPLLSRLSATWRLLLAPYRQGLQWLDADLDSHGFASLTACLMEVREFLTAIPPDPNLLRREAARIARLRREVERTHRPLFERTDHGSSEPTGGNGGEAQGRSGSA